MVSRLPDGMSGVEAAIAQRNALIDASPHINDERKQWWHLRHRAWAYGLGDASAGDYACRCSTDPGLSRQLTHEEWAEYKAAGGKTYSRWYYGHEPRNTHQRYALGVFRKRWKPFAHLHNKTERAYA